ncbi:DUF1236 domain-containing protein [Bradyrhizobium sp. KB893862 SZCCT0404]|uniref:DUF1236 domain-containing protein n=1 Tax=Bradyrhizobium sp. KB893862 SZCCT0404 TaxID=2807672 RepID=UPI001BA652E7|nr:DUF1236 domain-containing protein [Bradyrhizobium sp. KB893862 SZCCT0404]MBR1175846.1 DUF1236 domain-containing protein [Bradyrhizobium sp. KB893862 SZCCT0404]
MLNRFMISVAAVALVAGTGLANAQDKGRDTGGAGAQQQMQHSQPSGGAAERGSMGKESTHEKGTVGQAGGSMEKSGAAEKSGGMDKSGTMNKNAADEKAGAKGEHAQGAQDKSKSMSSDSTKPDSTKSGAKDMKAEDNKAGGAAKSNNAENRPGATDSKSQTTTGNASATAAAPPPEKRTEISTAIKSTKIEETTNVNFNISVGTAVPASVHFHPLPPRIVEIYPQWRGYEVILVRGQYVIVRPQTREIVYIIEG